MDVRVEDLVKMRRENLPHLLTCEEAGHVLRKRPSTVYQYARTGAIPAVRIKGRVLIPTDKLLAFIQAKTTGPEELMA